MLFMAGLPFAGYVVRNLRGGYHHAAGRSPGFLSRPTPAGPTCSSRYRPPNNQPFLSLRIASKTTERLGLMSEIVPSGLGLAPFLMSAMTSATLSDGSMAQSFAARLVIWGAARDVPETGMLSPPGTRVSIALPLS